MPVASRACWSQLESLFPQQYFVRNIELKANIANTNSYPPLNCDLHTGSGIGAPVDGFLFHSLLLLCVVSNGLFACFCLKMTFYQPGAYDHCVLYTTAQLTEGRSARDQPKQPPAKKNGVNSSAAGARCN